MRLRKKVLFFAEDVTLAHTGRMVALAQALDVTRYEPVLACGPAYGRFARSAGFRTVLLDSMSPGEFAQRLAAGQPIYSRAWLDRLVKDDLWVLEAERPDLVVSDFRCSLGISGELAQVPVFNVVNGGWSPASTQQFPMPDLWLERWFGVRLGEALFRLALPRALAQNVKDFNDCRRDAGLAPVENLQAMYTQGTATLYPDVPALAPVTALPDGHHYLGPVLWEPDCALPAWWNDVPTDRPVVYASLGSSGDARVLEPLCEALAELDVTALVATSGHAVSCTSERLFTAPYLPGLACAARADLVVCNGGSGAVYQALQHGRPVLGLARNADQHLVMGAVVEQGAGQVLRSGQATAGRVRAAVQALLADEQARARAQALRRDIAASNSGRSFSALVEDCIGGVAAARAA